MTDPTLTERVTVLEQKVSELASLPSRVAAVELQILHLRDEMRSEFSTVRRELTSVFRAELRTTADSLRTEIRAEIREGDEETRRYMRVLHEEVIARIAALGDAHR